MWKTEGFNPSISEVVKNHQKEELQKLEAERIIIEPTEQALLLSQQHAQWLYDKSEVHDASDMHPTLFRIQSMKECLRLSQDGEINPSNAQCSRHRNRKKLRRGNQMRRSSFLPTRNTTHLSSAPRRLTRRSGRPGVLRAFEHATSRSLLRCRTWNPTIRRSTWAS